MYIESTIPHPKGALAGMSYFFEFFGLEGRIDTLSEVWYTEQNIPL